VLVLASTYASSSSAITAELAIRLRRMRDFEGVMYLCAPSPLYLTTVEFGWPHIQLTAPMATLFFSYSHVDENLRDQLEVHLAGLKRQNLITAWHDRRIVAGSNLATAIDTNLESADVILLLISPNFIASDYCYDREMKQAMERQERGQARVIPVVLRPCDWHDLPFGKLVAAPKDGKPITTWANTDEAFLDVERAIKAALSELRKKSAPEILNKQVQRDVPVWREAASALGSPRSSNLRVKKEFSDLDFDRFRHEGYEFIARFFENSMQELVGRNASLEQRFQRVDATRFTAAVYRNGKKLCKGSAALSGRVTGSTSIEYTMDDNPRPGGMNEAVYVKSDEQSLYFEALGMQSSGEKLTMQGAAELFWEIFIRPLQ
jgi:hypothetical protein